MRDFRWIRGPLLAVPLLLAGCGGGGSAPPPAPTPSAGAFEGPWSGTLHSNGGATVSATALLLASGELRYVASNGIKVVGTTSVTGSSLSGNGTIYAPTGYIFNSSGAATAPFSLSGTGTGGASLTGTYSGAGDSGTFAFAYNTGANYDSPVILANVAGSYTSVSTSSGYLTTGTLSPTGTFSGSDALGSFSGTLSAVAAAKNAFRVTVTYSPTGQTARTYTGLAFFDFGLTPLHLYVQTTGASGQFAADFMLTGA